MSAKSAVTFSKEDARQDNTDDVPRGPPIVAFRPLTRLKTKQARRGEAESMVHEEVHYTTKELNEFVC